MVYLKIKFSYPHQLSSGQKQLVALLRGLASNPKIILLDEPFANLDTRLREKLRDKVLHILKDNNITSIIVTHDADEALFLSDLKSGNKFELSGRVFEKIETKRTRVLCEEISSGKKYLIAQLAKVRLIDE